MKSVIQFRPLDIKAYNAHNEDRILEDGVRSELTVKNQTWKEYTSLDEVYDRVCDIVRRETKSQPQPKSILLREAVVHLQHKTTMSDAKLFATLCKQHHKIIPYQIDIHADEGTYIEGVWYSFYHAHFVFGFVNEQTGRTLKLKSWHYEQINQLALSVFGLSSDEEKSVSIEEESISPNIIDIYDYLCSINLKIDKLLAVQKEKTPKMLDVSDISKIFGVSVGCVYNWRSSGRLIGYKVNGTVKFSAPEVIDLLQEKYKGDALNHMLERVYKITGEDFPFVE